MPIPSDSPLDAIRTEAEYDQALAEIDTIFEAKPGTPEGDRLEKLVTLVEGYELEHYPIPPPSPEAALEYYRESRGPA